MTPSSSLPKFDASESIMRIAGAWLARRDRGFSAAEQIEFDQWCAAHPSHAAAAAQLERTLFTFDRLRELAPADGMPPNRDAFAPPRRSGRWLRPALFATGMAAAIAIMFWPSQSPTSLETWSFTTPAGGYNRAALADGSTVELNTDTHIEVEYSPSARRVRLLRGEAHFQVAKDAARPFVVQASTVAVSAVGTAFNVKFAETGVEVLVTEGRVRVEPPAAVRENNAVGEALPARGSDIPLLTAGHKVVVATTPRSEPVAIATVSREEIERTLAWQSRVADFRKTPLRSAVAEFNRQNRRQIVIADPELETLRIGGNFRADQPEAFVRLLEASFGIAAERSGTVITLRKAPDFP